MGRARTSMVSGAGEWMEAALMGAPCWALIRTLNGSDDRVRGCGNAREVAFLRR